MLVSAPARHGRLARLLAEQLGDGASVLEAELARLRASGTAFPSDRHEGWSALLAACSPEARAALLRRAWPRLDATDGRIFDGTFLARLVVVVLATDLPPAALFELAGAAGLVRPLPGEEGLADWVAEVVESAGRAALGPGQGSAVISLLAELMALLPAEQARAFELRGLMELWLQHMARWQLDRRAEQAEQRAELRDRLRSLTAIQATLERLVEAVGALSRLQLHISGGVFQGVNLVVGGDARGATLSAVAEARAVAQDLDEVEALSRRWSPWAWALAAWRLSRPARWTPAQAEQAAEVARRLHGRLGWLLRRGLPAYGLLWLLSLSVPLWVAGALSAPPLAALLRALRPLVLFLFSLGAGVGGLVAVVEGQGEVVEAGQEVATEAQLERVVALLEGVGRGTGPVSRGREREWEALRERVRRWEAPEPPVPEEEPDQPPPRPLPAEAEEPPPEPEPEPAPPPEPPVPDPATPGAGDGPPEGATTVVADSAPGLAAAANATLPDGGPPLGAVGDPPTGGRSGRDHTSAVGGVRFIGLTGGELDMGSPDADPDAQDREKPQHRVRVGSFLVAERELTQAAWRAAVLAGRADPARYPEAAALEEDPSGFKGDDRPVERVFWCDALRFANLLSLLDGLERAVEVPADCESGGPVQVTGQNGYRLPTEVEWERAARAGTTTRYWSGDTEADLARVGWYDGNAGGQTRDTCALGEAGRNEWGLCDVHGNVWEWVLDSWDSGAYAGRAGGMLADPRRAMYTVLGAQNRRESAIQAGAGRVARGGSWNDSAGRARSAFRLFWVPRLEFVSRGFRLVLPAAPQPER